MTEKQIARKLIAHMAEFGWNVHSVDDGEETIPVATTKQAMEATFAVDEAWVRFVKQSPAGAHSHAIWLIQGNGDDLISDWTLPPEGSASVFDDFDDVVDNFLRKLEGGKV